MQQRDIYLADLNPSEGGEQAGTRPVVVISGSTMNQYFDVVIVCPLTSKVKNYASCISIKKDEQNGLATDSEIITFQVRTVSKNRLLKKVGEISEKQLNDVFKGLIEVLKY